MTDLQISAEYVVFALRSLSQRAQREHKGKDDEKTGERVSLSLSSQSVVDQRQKSISLAILSAASYHVLPFGSGPTLVGSFVG